MDIRFNDYQNMKRIHHKRMKPVKIGDQIFESISIAANHLRITGPTITKKIRKGQLINGMKGEFLPKENQK